MAAAVASEAEDSKWTPSSAMYVRGVGQHVHQMRDRRALVAADIGDAGLQQRLGDGENALAAEFLAVAELQVLHLARKDRSAMPSSASPAARLNICRCIFRGSRLSTAIWPRLPPQAGRWPPMEPRRSHPGTICTQHVIACPQRRRKPAECRASSLASRDYFKIKAFRQ